MSTKNSNFLGCRVNNERYQEVKALCEEQGRTVNDFLGEIIDNEINGSPDETNENEMVYQAEAVENQVAQVASEEENNASPGEPEEQDEEEPEELDNSTIKQIISHSLCFIAGIYLVVNGADLSALGIKGKYYRESSGVSGSF